MKYCSSSRPTCASAVRLRSRHAELSQSTFRAPSPVRCEGYPSQSISPSLVAIRNSSAERRELAVGRLERAVAIQQRAAHGAGVGRGGHPVDEAVERLAVHHGIVVQQQDVGRARRLDALIARAPEPEVAVVLDELHAGETGWPASPGCRRSIRCPRPPLRRRAAASSRTASGGTAPGSSCCSSTPARRHTRERRRPAPPHSPYDTRTSIRMCR